MPTIDEAAAAVAGGNPLDTAAQRVVDQQSTAVRASLYGALMANPEVAARATKISRQTGLPVDVVQRNIGEVERGMMLNDVDRYIQQSPGLAQALTRPEFASLAHDDLSAMGEVERAVRSLFGRAPRRPIGAPVPVMTGREFSAEASAVARQTPGLDPQTATILAGQGVRVDNQAQFLDAARGPAPSVGSVAAGLLNADRFRASSAGMSLAAADLLGFEPAPFVRRYETAQARAAGRDPAFESATAQGIYGGGVSLVQNAPALALGVMSGGAGLPLAAMFGQVAGQEYGKYRARGGTPGQAALGAALEGGIEVGTELLPMRFLVERFGKAGAAQFLTGLLAREVPTEQLATLAQDAVDTAIANPDKTWADFLRERPGAAYQTLLATLTQSGVMGAANVAAGKIAGFDARAAEAERLAERVQQFSQLAEATKLKARDGETFKEFIEQVADEGDAPAEFYVSAEQLANSLSQSGMTMDEFRAVAPVAAAQLDAAQYVPGADVRVPVAEFSAAPSTLTAPLVDHLREAPDAMSRIEAQEYLSTQGETIRAEVEAEIGRQTEAQQAREQTDAVIRQFEAELNQVGRFRKEANRAYATLLGNFYSTMAMRLGMTPQEMVEKYRLRVAGADGKVAGGQVLTQEAIQTPEFKAWFGDSKVVDAEGRPLVVYHGTSHSQDGDAFTMFDTYASNYGLMGQGGYFTADPAVASTYTKKGRGDTPTVYPVYLSIKNPLDMDAKADVEAWARQFPDAEAFHEGGDTNESWYRAAEDALRDQGIPMYEGAEAMQDGLRSMGHDGITHMGGGRVRADGARHRVFVAFDPEQVKSAIGNRGTFDPNDPNILNQQDRARLLFGQDITQTPSVIQLLQGADLSSFLHESGHFFLEVMGDLAIRIRQQVTDGGSITDAERQILDDMDTVLAWGGIKGDGDVTALDRWSMMTLDERREAHEQFARGFERYAMEGNAPSIELKSVFARFRDWLKTIYRKLTELNVTLTDEVRQVMDRMLATDQAIEEMQAQRAMGALFRDAESAGMTLAEYRAYQALGEKATQDARDELQARSLKDLKWLSRARAKELKRLQAEANDLRREAEREARAEVMSQPVYQAWQFLTGSGEESGKINLRDLRLLYGESYIADEILDPLVSRGMTSNTGMDAEAVAAMFGFQSADQLVKAIGDSAPPDEVVANLTDMLMLERHGDITSPQALERAADEAVHNEARLRFIAHELKALEKAATVRAGKRSTIDVLAAAARDYAAEIIGRQKVRDLRPAQYGAAEARSAKLAEKAVGNLPEAAMHKRNQLVNAYAAKAAYAALDEVQRGVKYLRKFDREGVRKNLPLDYLDQIDQMLERFDLRPASGAEVERRQSLAAWVQKQNDLGLDPLVPDDLLAKSRLTNYRDMTVAEFRELVDSIKNIEHLGRLKSKLLKAQDQREFAAVAADIVAAIQDSGKKNPVRLEPRGRAANLLANFWIDHRKLNSLAHQMDGRDGGPLFNALIRTMNESGTQENVMLEKATMALADIYSPVLKLDGGLNGGKVHIPSIGASLSRAGRLAVALNWGNTQNRQRVMDGDGWNERQVMDILRTLSPVELEFVNKVWEHLDSYWPDVKAKQERVYGTVEQKVRAEPFAVTASDGTTVQMRGGYYPIKYDADRSLKSSVKDAEEIGKEMLRGAIGRATTRRSHTKARADEIKGRPIRKDLSPITQHVNQVVHDLAWHEWVIDANRLLNDTGIAEAVRDYYGPEYLSSMKDAVSAIAVGDLARQNVIDQMLMKARANVTRSIMGMSLTTAFLQPFGLTQSMAKIGTVPVLKGAARWAGDAARMQSTLKWVYEKSDFMRLRAKTFNRELREISQRVQGTPRAAQVLDASLFFLMQKLQMVADVPTWIGAYEKALAAGSDEATAVALADEAVVSSQGGGDMKDLSAVQRDHPFLTQFYSYFNATLQLTAESTAKTDFKNPRAVAGWAADMALLLVVPAILPAMITYLLKGGGEDDEPEKWAKKLAEWQAAYLFGMFVGLREIPVLWSPFEYGGPPVAKLINDGKRFVQQANQGEIDDKAVLATIGLLGTVFGLPTTQVIRSYKGWEAWDNGDAPATSILMGPPPKD